MLALGGCVERTLTINSQPPGAVAYVSSVEIGRTPVTIPFTWYGDYDVILRREGYETLKTHYNVNPPLYEIPPFDLFSEMAPWTYRDNRIGNFTLVPATQPSEPELLERAQQLREKTLQGSGLKP